MKNSSNVTTVELLLKEFGHSMKVAEVAKVLRVDPNTVYQKSYRGDYSFKFTAKPRRVSTVEVAKYLDGS